MKSLIVILFCTPIVITACHFGNNNRIKGNGNIKTETRNTGSFNSVEVNGNIQLFVKQDSSRTIRIEADENLMSHIVIKTDGDQLVIEPTDNDNLDGTKDIKVYVSSPIFEALEASGASGITGENILSGESFNIEVSGASNAKLELKSPKVNSEISGASHMMLKGQTKDLYIDVSGASHAKCFELLSENANVDADGASSAEVFASVNLKADASGASHIRYKGAANYVGNSSGAGSINKVE